MTAPPSGLGRLASLLGALDPQGPPPSPREIAELIWLGQHLPQDMTSGRWDEPGPVDGKDAASSAPGQGGDITSAAAEVADSSDRLYLPEGSRPSSTPHAGLRAAALRVTGAAALPRRRALARVLRPLKRRVPSVARTVLDEDATADAVARDGRWLPFLVPAEDRWLDVQLIIDADSDCADLWSPLGRDLRKTFQELGAFRDVRSYWLHRQDDGRPLLAGGPVAAGPLRSAAAAVDPTGRTLTLVLTDGVAAWWRSANLRTALLRWATTGPTAILQPLPDHLWERTALAPSPGRFRNTSPGAPNSWLHFTPYALGARPARPDEVPVPVLGIEPDWLAPWAHALAATGAFDGAALVLHPDPAGSEITAGPAAVPPRQQVSFEDFLAQSDPRVFQLAAYLSAAPLNLPVMRLIQAAMLPESLPSDLAEIVFGGLLYKVPADSTDALPPAYDFAPAVRNRLRSTLRRDEADAVLAAVSAHIRNHTSSTTRFTAAAPDQHGPLVLPPNARHWAQVRGDVRRRQGQPAPAADEPAYQGEDAVGPATTAAAEKASMAQGDPTANSESLRHLSPAATTPERWPGEPSQIRLVMLASIGAPPPAGSSFRHAGTGFLLGPRLILTAAYGVSRHSRSWTLQARSRRGPIAADGWIDCHLLWIDNATGAALLLADDDLAEPSTDRHFSAPRWARLTGDKPLSPCHVTGVIVANEASPQTSGHLTGILHPSSFHPCAAYDFEFELAISFPRSRALDSLGIGMSGAPVFIGEFLLGFVTDTTRDERPGRLRLPVTGISALAASPEFTEICSRYMRRIPRVDVVPASFSVREGDRTDALAGHRRHRIFISYVPEDDNGAHAEQVHNLIEVLKAAGIDVRLAPDEIVGSRNWTTVIRREMEAADVILVIGSPTYRRHVDAPPSDTDHRVSVASEAHLLRDEITHGPAEPTRKILPVLLPGRTSKDLPALLRPLRPLTIDPITGAGVDQVLYRLALNSRLPWTPGAIAHSLITQSDQLAATGSTGEALAAAREAVSRMESPAQADADSMRPVLAMALSTLSNRLAENGEREEALATAEQAVMIRQQLMYTDSKARYDYARSLSNLSSRLADLGRHQEALSTINDAIDSIRQFANSHPDTYLPDLATMLNNQGAALQEAGRTSEALNAISEAVSIWRQLAEADPNAVTPGLASALLNLSSMLSETGRAAEALSTVEEAAFLYRKVAGNSPGTPSPRLATALHHLSLRLADLHRWDEALQKSEEAIAVRRGLSATNPETFLPDLARSLSAAAWIRTSTGRGLQSALDEAKEAVHILSQFVAQQPTVFTNDLRHALNVQAEILDVLGRSAEAARVRSRARSSGTAGETPYETANPSLTEPAPPSLGDASTSSTPDALRTLITGARAVLFDFDGPICRLFAGHSAERVVMDLVEWLEERGLHGLLPEANRDYLDPQMVLRAADRRYPGSDLIAELEERLTQQELRATAAAMPTPYADLLIRTWAAVGAQLAVVTNNSPRVVRRYLADRGLADCFGPYIFGRTADLHQLKPAPQSVNRALNAMNIPPSRALMIGDSPSDFIASQEAGVAFLGYARYGDRQRHLHEVGAEMVVSSLEPVVSILRSQA